MFANASIGGMTSSSLLLNLKFSSTVIHSSARHADVGIALVNCKLSTLDIEIQSSNITLLNLQTPQPVYSLRHLLVVAVLNLLQCGNEK
jgi:hypothetical protein